MKASIAKNAILTVFLLAVDVHYALAAIALDRTRVVFDGSKKSVSLGISNENTQLPYLAQGWIEDSEGNKITNPFVILPPVQRVEPKSKSQIKIQALPSVNSLPQDRETLFYINLREIPPKSDKANTMQLALQSRIKLFYRPASISQAKTTSPWQEKITLTKVGNQIWVNNPTPYFITLIGARVSEKSEVNKNFKSVMIEPKGRRNLSISASELGNTPVLTYINDYGGRPLLHFRCESNSCFVDTNHK